MSTVGKNSLCQKNKQTNKQIKKSHHHVTSCSKEILIFRVLSHVMDNFRTKNKEIFRGYFIGNFNEDINTAKSKSDSVISDSLRHYWLYSPWTSPGQNSGVGSLSLLQRIFPTQGLNPGLLHCRRILYQLSYKQG